MNVSSLELDQQDARFMIGVDHAKLCKVSAQTSQDNTWGVTGGIYFFPEMEYWWELSDGSPDWNRVIVREIVASWPGQSLGDCWLWGLYEVPCLPNLLWVCDLAQGHFIARRPTPIDGFENRLPGLKPDIDL
jgi:hypothetical protein